MFIERLEEVLKEKKLTLNKLAKAIGYSQSSTSRWKNGSSPSIEILAEICKYLNISADYLLELNDKTPPPKEEILLIEYFRQADERGQENILELAQREAERNNSKETSLNLKNIG